MNQFEEPPAGAPALVEVDLTTEITIQQFTTDKWREVAGADPRGFQWCPPGTYIVATHPDGGHLAEIKVNYLYDANGLLDESGHGLRVLTRALASIYAQEPGR